MTNQRIGQRLADVGDEKSERGGVISHSQPKQTSAIGCFLALGVVVKE